MRRVTVALVVAAALTAGIFVVRAPSRDESPSAQAAPERVDHTASSGPASTAGTPTEEDAIAAAVRYATASQDWLYLADDALDRAVRSVASPEAAEQLGRETVAELGPVRDALAAASGPVWWLVRPLATRVERFDPDQARVVVWTVTVLSAADVALPQADWSRVAVDLEWDAGWKLRAMASTPGPTPGAGTEDRPWQPEPLDDALRGFQRVGVTG